VHCSFEFTMRPSKKSAALLTYAVLFTKLAVFLQCCRLSLFAVFGVGDVVEPPSRGIADHRRLDRRQTTVVDPRYPSCSALVFAGQKCSMPSNLARQAVTDAFSAYQGLLETFPLATKSVTSSVLFGVGDVIAQFRQSGGGVEENKQFNADFRRLANYMIIGLGSGILWAFWYEFAQAVVYTGVSNEVLQVVYQIVLEQFVWCPLLYSLYLIPMGALLNGGDLNSAWRDVQTKLLSLLEANAKLWTFANMLIYAIPLQWRVLAASFFELVWSNYCSEITAGCGQDDEQCSIDGRDKKMMGRIPFREEVSDLE